MPSSPLFSTEAQNVSVLYGFSIHNDVIYIADAKDYTSNGVVFTYSTQGELLHNYSVKLILTDFILTTNILKQENHDKELHIFNRMHIGINFAL